MRYTEDELRSLFQQKFSRKAWTGFLQNFMEGARLRSVPEEFHTPSDNEKGFFLGEYNTSDHYRIGLFQFDVKTASIARKRVGLRNLVKSLINPNWGEFDAAFTVFASDSDWRLSFICDIKEEKTAPKRFTYVFGDEEMLYRTPVKRLYDIQGKVTFASLKKAFSVKELSDEFFYEYRDIYADFVQYITGNRYVKKTQGSGYELKSFPGEPQNMTFYQALGCDDKRARDFVKKMMGRITFLYFLQQKGWMCGDKNYMLHLFESSSDKDYYLKKVLVPLFFGVLNTKPEERKAVFAEHKWNDELRKAWETIPYLNGGLFEPDDEDKVVDACSTHIFRQKDFEELFEFYSHYNFTIDENDPSDAEVGVDPEMLGKIFESLLEDNKDKGAYYTPKDIVQYMCQESLVAYLVTKTHIEEGRLREFVKEPEDNKDRLTEDERYKILDGVLSVKICDPAIGSGAFPIGLLNELVRCKEAIYGDKKGRADIKREIIRDNIYGVDIEKGAVDIARLRFWLSLVVDEDTPSPLPNLDYKIMQGNSLLEWYNGTDLSKLTDMAASDDLFGGGRAEELKKDLAKLLKRYFGESDHEKKFALKGAIKAAITEILDIAGVEIPDGIDIAENSQFFLWHTWYNEVFANNGGFDICLGNPPYLATRSGLISNYDKNAYRQLFRTAEGQFDLYGLFIEHGLNILKPSGIEVLITESTFVSNQNFKTLRKILITENTYNQLIYLGENVFESANVDVSISIVSKQKAYEHSIRLCRSYEAFNNNYFDAVSQSLYDEPEYDYEINVRATENDLALFKRAKTISQYTLGSIAELPRGAEFGSDADCIVNRELSGYDKLIVGRDIKKYLIEFNDRYVLFDNSNVSVFKEKRYYSEPKLLIQRIRNLSLSERIVATYDDSGYICTNTLRMLYLKEEYNSSLDLKFILGILNSRLINRFFLRMFLNKDIYRYQLERLPIPSATKEQQAPIISLVDDILATKKANPSADTSVQEAEIDRLVYDLYDVPQEERK